MLRNEPLLQEEQMQPVFSAGTVGAVFMERCNIVHLLLLMPWMKKAIVGSK